MSLRTVQGWPRSPGCPHGPRIGCTGVTANVLIPGGMTDTNIIPEDAGHDRASLMRSEVMQAPAVWLSSDESEGTNGMRFIAYNWDESLPIEQRLEKAGAPAAWPQLGRQAIIPSQ